MNFFNKYVAYKVKSTRPGVLSKFFLNYLQNSLEKNCVHESCDKGVGSMHKAKPLRSY